MEQVNRLFTKESIKVLKGQIKKAVDDQKATKNQRKSDEKISGARQMPQSSAQSAHAYNRLYLRYCYAAYGIMRGKDIYKADAKIDISHPGIKTVIDAIIQTSIELSGKAVCDNQS